MEINFYPPSKQANGNFNFGEILEKKPIGFPQDGGQLKPFQIYFTGPMHGLQKKEVLLVCIPIRVLKYALLF